MERSLAKFSDLAGSSRASGCCACFAGAGRGTLINMPVIPLQPTPGGCCGQQSFSLHASVSSDGVKDNTQRCHAASPSISSNFCFSLNSSLTYSSVFIPLWVVYLRPLRVSVLLHIKLHPSPDEELSGSLAACSRAQTPIKASDHEPGMTLSQG